MLDGENLLGGHPGLQREAFRDYSVAHFTDQKTKAQPHSWGHMNRQGYRSPKSWFHAGS